MSEQYEPIRPETLYGTREFEMARAARMSSPKAPVRRRAVDEAKPAPFAGLRGAVAHYDAVWARLNSGGRHETPPVKLAPIVLPAPAAKPVPETFGPPLDLYLAWMTRDRIYVIEIIKATVRHFETCLPDILGQSRHGIHIMPRHIAIYLARTLTPRTLPELGTAFGGRDHTTILNSVRRIQRLLDDGDERVTADVAAIRAKLEARS